MKKSCEEWLTAQFGDDRETIESMYAEYVETMADLERQLTAACASEDAAAIDRILHTIKGSAGMAGDGGLSALANDARKTGDAALRKTVLDELRKLPQES